MLGWLLLRAALLAPVGLLLWLIRRGFRRDALEKAATAAVRAERPGPPPA